MKQLYVILLISLCMHTRAQQITVPDLKLKPLPFTMFWNSKSLFNPAAGGIENKYYAALIGGKQWMGLKNAPENIGVIMEMKSDFLHGATGINYVYTGGLDLSKIHEFNANYSYHINLGNERVLSAGFSGGLTLVKYDYSMDWPLVEDKGTTTFYDFQLGLFYRSNHLLLGLSSNHFEHLEVNSAGKEMSSDVHIYSSYRFDIGEILDINPELLISSHKLYSETILVSSALIFTVKDRFWTGLTYRTDNTYGGMAGFDIAGMVRIGYLYETRTKVSGIENYGNHELLIAVMLN